MQLKELAVNAFFNNINVFSNLRFSILCKRQYLKSFKIRMIELEDIYDFNGIVF